MPSTFPKRAIGRTIFKVASIKTEITCLLEKKFVNKLGELGTLSELVWPALIMLLLEKEGESRQLFCSDKRLALSFEADCEPIKLRFEESLLEVD